MHYSCLGNPVDRGAWGLQSIGSQSIRYYLAIRQEQQQITKPDKGIMGIPVCSQAGQECG